jgi:hypothetical protein
MLFGLPRIAQFSNLSDALGRSIADRRRAVGQCPGGQWKNGPVNVKGRNLITVMLRRYSEHFARNQLIHRNTKTYYFWKNT